MKLNPLMVWCAWLACQDAAPLREHRIMVLQYDGTEGRRILELSEKGKVVWEHRLSAPAVMFQLLPDQHVVFAHGGEKTGATEVDRAGNVVWTYASHCKEVMTCERLPNGNTLLAEQGPSQAVEVNPKGEIVSTVPLPTTTVKPHRQIRCIHTLANGHILAAVEEEGAAKEVDKEGKVVWEYRGLADVFEAIRLKNGNTLIAGGTQKRVVEVTPEGKVAWELNAKDVPELHLTWITSLQELRNGNFAICNFLRGQAEKGAHAFEITREKKVVWTFADHERVAQATMVRVLDDE